MPTKLTNSERELARLALRREDSLLKQLKKIYRNAFTGVKQVVQQMLGIKLPTQSQIYQLKYQKQLAKNLQQALKPLKSSNLSTFEEYLKESYSNGYIGTLYNMQKQGVPLLLPMDKRQMLKAVSRTNDDIKLSTKLYKDVDKLADTVRHEITRGIAVGASYEDIARNVSYRGNVSLNNAMRIARTEGGRIASEATLEAMHDAKAKGVDVVKVWCSTLDGKTRESHQLLDGVIKELDEEFVTIDGKRAMYPQGFNDPSEDCNCRCTLLQRPRSALGEKNTRYSNDLGENIECKDYTEFKEKYLQKMEERSIIKEQEKVGISILDNAPRLENHSMLDCFDTTNPGYSTGKEEYTRNCQRCVCAYEARRRGYDVVASKRILDGTDTLPCLGHPFGFQNVFENGKELLEKIQARTGKAVQNSIIDKMESFGDGTRAFVAVYWQDRIGGGGHTFIVEQINGKTVFIDPQTGNYDCSNYFASGMIIPSMTRLLRIDDKKFTNLIEKCVKLRR